ncbi:DUF5916 domain-containing protein, partial [Xanthovirga aplysinae]|uniref:DUF5916 domain-containing protein n=1 Tax=Xanthovirga aplysinae TaxID=2529853 RepID=UPI0012BB9812
KKIQLLLLLLVLSTTLFAQNSSKKQLQAIRTEASPIIDGQLDEEIWTKAPKGIAFIQNRPEPGKRATQDSEVSVLYDDFALYVGAKIFDHPDSIRATLTARDNVDQTDWFMILLDPYQGGLNGVGFLVSAAGVQGDYKYTVDGMSGNWNAVWESKVRQVEDGWIAEMMIPYSAIRFAKKDVQKWGVNFGRSIVRTGEEVWWNEVSPDVNGFINQAGELTGISNIKPPVRLSVSPYVSTYLGQSSEGEISKSINGGMDLKYGINDAITLDMTLIPDFGQVRSDNHVLNLSQFEVRYDENRQFFTEGTELFNKGNLFYSRRVGQSFGGLDYDEDTEEVSYEPSEAPMLNATKISGRLKGGLGIGVFNALTNKTTASIKNIESGQEREVLVDPLTNFNVFVLDQNLKNNSSVTLINTNVFRGNYKGEQVFGETGKDANVTGGLFSINDKQNIFNLEGSAMISQIFTQDQETKNLHNKKGYKYHLEFEKVSGKIRYEAGRSLTTKDFDPNDMGYLRNANIISHWGRFSYVLNNKPNKYLNNFRFNLFTDHSMLYQPRWFNNWSIFTNVGGQLSNFWFLRLNFGIRPIWGRDHFEPREENWYVNIPPNFNVNFVVGTDYRKPFSILVYTGIFRRNLWKQTDNWMGFEATYIVNEKLRFFHELNFNIERDDRGWVDTFYDDNDEPEQIILGTRDVQTFVNTFNGQYTFNDRMGITFRLRHYWSKVPYYTGEYFELQNNGDLIPIVYDDLDENQEKKYDKNYNAFNIDMVYTWRFAPGSELSLVWKNAIETDDNKTDFNFISNLDNTLSTSASNSLSLKILYFLDYINLKRSLSKAKS